MTSRHVANQFFRDIDPSSVVPFRPRKATSPESAAQPETRPRKRDMPRRLPVFLRGQENQHLLAATHSERDFTITQVALLAGLRVSEIVHLRVEDLDFDESTLMVNLGKGRKDRLVPMPTQLAMTLRTWIGKRTDGYVFAAARSTHGTTGHLAQRTVQRVVKQAAEAAGIARKVTPHKLRHTYATRALRAGLSLREVQELLGHASVATTEIYTHVVVDDRVKSRLEQL